MFVKYIKFIKLKIILNKRDMLLYTFIAIMKKCGKIDAKCITRKIGKCLK